MNSTRSTRIVILITHCVLFTIVSAMRVEAQTRLESDVSPRQVMPISTTISDSAREKLIIRLKTSIRWEEQEYNIDDGIDLLMDIITDPVTDVSMRSKAINRLGHFSTQLQNRECLPKLCSLYNQMETRNEKLQILRCLIGVKDPAGLNLFHRIVTTKTDPHLRNSAAVGLADWNIREGVYQLIELFASNANIGFRDVGASAMISFTSLNERKEWKCPQDEMREKSLEIANGNREKYGEALMHEYRTWFEKNKHRFPEWKAGDPLPKIEQKNKSD